MKRHSGRAADALSASDGYEHLEMSREYLIYRNLRRRISNHPVLPKTSWLLNVHEKRGQREQSQPRTGAFVPSLERLAIQLQDHQKSDLTLSKWAFRVTIGLEVENRPLLRAFSVVSANYDEHLESYSIKSPTVRSPRVSSTSSRAMRCYVSTKPTGTLIVANVRPGSPALSLGERNWPELLHEHHP